MAILTIHTPTHTVTHDMKQTEGNFEITREVFIQQKIEIFQTMREDFILRKITFIIGNKREEEKEGRREGGREGGRQVGREKGREEWRGKETRKTEKEGRKQEEEG